MMSILMNSDGTILQNGYRGLGHSEYWCGIVSNHLCTSFSNSVVTNSIAAWNPPLCRWRNNLTMINLHQQTIYNGRWYLLIDVKTITLHWYPGSCISNYWSPSYAYSYPIETSQSWSTSVSGNVYSFLAGTQKVGDLERLFRLQRLTLCERK